jgi:Mg2+ and Co2+ transporter CorA
MSQQEITDALQQAVDLSKLVAVAQQSVGEKAAVITKIFKQYEKQIAVWAAAGNVRSAAE